MILRKVSNKVQYNKTSRTDSYQSGLLFLIPRRCRVWLSFEPAFAGGSLPRNAALAQAYRVISLLELKTLLIDVGSKRNVQHHEHSRDKFFIP